MSWSLFIGAKLRCDHADYEKSYKDILRLPPQCKLFIEMHTFVKKQYKNLQKVQTNFYIDLILVASLSCLLQSNN